MRSHQLKPRMIEFATALRAQRKALHLTQVQLSQLSGCGSDFVYDVEAGKPSLRLDKLLDLLEVLGLTLVLRDGKGRLQVEENLRSNAAPQKATRIAKDKHSHVALKRFARRVRS